VTHDVLVDVGVFDRPDIAVPKFVELEEDDGFVDGGAARVGEARVRKSVVLEMVSGFMGTSVSVVVLVTGGSLAGSVVVEKIVTASVAACEDKSAVAEGADVD
jgi:hypothetical protein